MLKSVLVTLILFTTFIIMFHVVQKNPTDSTLIGSFKSKERAQFVMDYLKIHNPQCNYQIETL